MRRIMAMLAVTVVMGALLVPSAAQAGRRLDGAVAEAGRRLDGAGARRVGADSEHRAALKMGLQVAAKRGMPSRRPVGANPYLALLADPAKADYAGWRRWMTAHSGERARARARDREVEQPPRLVDEQEPAGTNGANDTPAAGQRIEDFGTRGDANPRARVLGRLSPDQVTAEAVEPNTENDGAIRLARDTGITTERSGITTTGTIGDGPYGSRGSGTGDFDFYRLRAPAGMSLTVDINTPAGDLDSMVVLYNAAGTVLSSNDDFDGDLDSRLLYDFTESGTYYVMVTGFAAQPNDPNDPASGTGAGSEGPYEVGITVAKTDVDFFAVRLRKGDVLGASVTGEATRLAIYDSAPREVQGSAQDSSFIFAATTPLPGGGKAVTEHVVDEDGWHYVRAGGGAGSYDITVEAHRPGLEGQRTPQTLFLDFDGARLNTAIFGGPGVRTLSPLRAFLARWGLTPDDEEAVIEKVIDTVRENLREDLADSGFNDRFSVRIRNSREHTDTFGKPNVSRVIVSGTMAESGVETIGIAQSIDPGNFTATESALVLLDTLSAERGEPASLNTYLTAASDRVAFVGRALGNVVAHEAGHFFGDWHVDQFDDQANLMDQGGNFPVMFAVGADNVGGTSDDPDVDFGENRFNPSEGFTGTEDTLSRLVFGLTR